MIEPKSRLNVVTKRRPSRSRKNPIITANDSQYSSAAVDEDNGFANELTVEDMDNNCEVQFYEYNTDSSSDDKEGLENRNKITNE